MSFDSLLTIYSLYLVFVIFCFQEINNKVRESQDRFREWCAGRKEELKDLKINWEYAAWLEKDLVFHLYDFKLKINEAKERIKNKNAFSVDHVIASHKKAAEDYYDYLFQCYSFKNTYKRIALIIFIFLFIIKILFFIYPKDNCLHFLKYFYVSLIMFSVYMMLKGPDFKFTNNPVIQQKNSLKEEEKKEINKLEELIKEI